MSVPKQMIIIRGEITSGIELCQYNPEDKKWHVCYKNNKKIYNFNFENVEIIKNPQILDHNMYCIKKDGKPLFQIDKIYVFQGREKTYWHLCFKNGTERGYERDLLEVQESCLMNKKTENVFTYFSFISQLSDLKNEITGKKILAEKYEKLKYVGDDTALAVYLNPSHKKVERRKETIPIFPFGCNKSQYRAVKNALENQISVIQGPPGTGKTQTILNIIANILMQGKTVQIVSNNNAAINNVYEKLASDKYKLDFIAASLGNSNNKITFIQNQNAVYPDFSSWMMNSEHRISLQEIQNKSAQLGEVFESQEKLSCLRQELAQLEVEKRYFDEYLNETKTETKFPRKKKIASEQLMLLWQECQRLSENNQKAGLLFRLKNMILYGIHDKEFYKQNISNIIMAIQKLFYECKKEELEREIFQITKFLQGTNSSLLDELTEQSMQILKDTLAKQYKGKTNRQVFKEDDLWKNPEEVLREYPVILSTTFSSRSSLNENVVYDYLIMDEASQVDVATGALALSCAKNAVIVGDTKQLPNVVTDVIRQQSEDIFCRFKISEGYRFTKSFLQSVLEVIPDVTQVLLREHYRCHPKIINFCNQKFYRGELVIMTEDKGEKDVLTAIKTKKGNHARNHYSQRQIDVIKEEVMQQLDIDLNEAGIITPYKNQVSALKAEIAEIDTDTVHKFQGREKDTIIISTVDDIISDFADDPYLLNVAVSRAKKKLVLVVSGNEQSKELNISDLLDYIQYHNFEIKESMIYSVFDYLYKQYSEARKKYLQKYKKISDYDSENLMNALLTDILKDNTYASLDFVPHVQLMMLVKNPALLDDRECEFVMNPGTHLDFLIYNRISKQPVLAVEVDGCKYHKRGTVQEKRDFLKDRILEKYSIPILRLPTNGSGEKEKITKKLEMIVGV